MALPTPEDFLELARSHWPKWSTARLHAAAQLIPYECDGVLELFGNIEAARVEAALRLDPVDVEAICRAMDEAEAHYPRRVDIDAHVEISYRSPTGGWGPGGFELHLKNSGMIAKVNPKHPTQAIAGAAYLDLLAHRALRIALNVRILTSPNATQTAADDAVVELKRYMSLYSIEQITGVNRMTLSRKAARAVR